MKDVEDIKNIIEILIEENQLHMHIRLDLGMPLKILEMVYKISKLIFAPGISVTGCVCLCVRVSLSPPKTAGPIKKCYCKDLLHLARDISTFFWC